MVFIENDGALFRGPGRAVPLEVWAGPERGFVPYSFDGDCKSQEWGWIISEDEANEIVSELAAGQ
jgi:hypothetical protein